MIKRSPSRNPKSKCIKVKHVLQICLLLGVCFWLIYQIKHSHDKKKEFDQKDGKVSVRAQSDDIMLKLGRKDLHPLDQVSTNNGKDEEENEDIEEVTNIEENKHEQEEEEINHEEEEHGGTKHEEEEKEEQNKHEEEEIDEENKPEEDEREQENKDEEEEREEESQHEEEQEDETKTDETEDEGRGGGDDEIDEHDREKVEVDANHEGNFIDEEKEREEDVEDKENENNEFEEETQTEQETTSEDQDHDMGGHEAREEHYKADDASSAVTHDVQVTSTESENTNENSSPNRVQQEASSIKNETKDINGGQSNPTLQLKQSETGEGDPTLNFIADGKKNGETIKSNSENIVINNSTGSSVSDDQPVLNIETAEASTVAGNNSTAGQSNISASSKKSETVIVSDLGQGQNAAAGGTGGTSHLESTKLEQVNENTVSDGIQSDSNQIIPEKTENLNTSGRESESDVSDQKIKSEVTYKAEVNSGASTTKHAADAAHDENLNTNNESGEIGENSGSSSTNAIEDPVIHDSVDSSESSIVQDEKEARIDLGTLPNTEELNIEEAAAE